MSSQKVRSLRIFYFAGQKIISTQKQASNDVRGASFRGENQKKVSTIFT